MQSITRNISIDVPSPRLAAAVAAAFILGSAGTAAAQQGKPTTPAHQAQQAIVVKEATPGLAARATVAAATANATALAAVPGGHIQEAEIEEEHGRLVYSYDIKVPGRGGIDEVLIDAKTGAVVSKSHEGAAAERREAAADRKSAHAAAGHGGTAEKHGEKGEEHATKPMTAPRKP